MNSTLVYSFVCARAQVSNMYFFQILFISRENLRQYRRFDGGIQNDRSRVYRRYSPDQFSPGFPTWGSQIGPRQSDFSITEGEGTVNASATIGEKMARTISLSRSD